VKANDDAPCATHFLHKIAVDDAGNVHTVFIDNRYLTGNLFHTQSPPAADGVDLAFGTGTFVNSQSFEFSTDRDNQLWLGDYIGFNAAGGALYAVWGDPRNGSSQVFFARSKP
jgi:hypothetical protein